MLFVLWRLVKKEDNQSMQNLLMIWKTLVLGVFVGGVSMLSAGQELTDTTTIEAFEVDIEAIPAVDTVAADSAIFDSSKVIHYTDDALREETGLDLDPEELAWDSLMLRLNIENDTDFTGFQMLDSIVGKYSVFFIGENHQFRHSNQKLHLKMLKYLYYNAGVRTLILEFGVSSGWLMNEYIQSGDSALFQVFETYAYKAWINFIKELCEWNLTLDSNDRVHIVGIDVERFETIPLKVLSLVLPNDKPIPDQISLSVESLKSMVTYLDKEAESDDDGERDYFWSMPTYDVDNHVDQLLIEYAEYKEVYKQYLGEEKFRLFDTVMVSLKDHRTYTDYVDKRLPQGPIYRERYMFDQFTRLLHQYPDGKFFGQFGRCHVGTINQEEACTWHNFNSIAQRINHSKDSLIAGRVCSIATFYPNSDSFEDEVDEISELREIAGRVGSEGLTMLRLRSGDTRFGKLPEMYQFLIINNSTLEDEEEAELDEEVVEEDDGASDGPFLILSYARQYRKYDLRGLNNQLSNTTLYNAFNTTRGENNIEVGIYWPGIYNALGVTFSTPELIFTTDGALDLQSLSSYSLQYSLGFANLQNRIHYNSRINLKYERMRFEMLELTELGDPRIGIYGEPMYSTFIQDGFLIGLQAGLGVGLFDFIDLEAFACYNLDVGSAAWRMNDVSVEMLPSTRLNGLMVGASVGVLIPLKSGKRVVEEFEF